MAAVIEQRRAAADLPAIDVAQAAELTGVSKNAIRARIRRHGLDSDLRDGRYRIRLDELLRGGLLVEGGRYRSLRKQNEALEAELRTTRESREKLRRELEDAEEKLRVVWGMARQRDQKLMRVARRRHWLRLPFRHKKTHE